MTTTSQSPNLDQRQTWIDVLGILHYVYGGVLVAALLVGIVFVTVVFGWAGLSGDLEPGVFVPIAMAGFGLLFALALGIANLFAGRWLRARRQWVGSLVVAAINCLNVPVGTLLGVFTIVVLAGDGMRGVFGDRPPTPPHEAVRPGVAPGSA